MVNKDSTITLS